MQAKIKAAIANSRHYNHSVAIELPATDISDAMAEIGAAWDGDTDYAQENDGTYDVWGWNDETQENEQAWRLRVTIKGITVAPTCDSGFAEWGKP